MIVFDFDGTIYNGDSFIDFAIFACGKKRFFAALLKSLPAIVAWKLGVRSNENAKQKLFSNLFKDMPFEEFCYLGREFSVQIASRSNKAILRLIEKFRSEQNPQEMVIASASMPQWIEPWAADSGFKYVIGTEPEIKDGKLTGRFATPNCHGAEKLRRIIAQFPDFPQRHTLFYTDSLKADKPMAESASQSFIVKDGSISEI